MADSNELNVLVESVVATVRATLEGATDVETELTNSGAYRVVEGGKLCGFASTGEMTLTIRFVAPRLVTSPEEAKRATSLARRRMKLVTPDDVEHEERTGALREFKLKGA